MSDLISVVLPTYNGEKYLRESIESVIRQTYENWELIIVNDASTDSTLDIAKEYADKDKRISIISNETNQKLPKSLNIGFANAKGEYYTWTSDDNLYKPQAFEKMLGALNQDTSADMVHCDIDFIDENGEKISEYKVNSTLEKLLSANGIGPCFLYRKSIALKIGGGYNENLFLVEDYDYWLRIKLESKIIKCNENLYSHRIHKDSLTSTKSALVYQKAFRLREHYWDIFLRKYPHLKDTQEFSDFQIEKIKKLLNSTSSKDDIMTLCKQLTNFLSSKELYKFYRSKYKETRNSTYLKAMNELGVYGKLKALKYKIKDFFQTKNDKNGKSSHLRIERFFRAKQWISDNTIRDSANGGGRKQGIAIANNQRVIYPEVTGYYIPTLLKWGERELAKSYADYLLTIQNEDGSWNEPYGKYKYTFDTGQILKGLWEFIDKDEKYKNAFLKGCDYIVAQQRDDGSIATDNYDWWKLPYGKVVPESIHLYCLEPLQNAAKKFNIPKYEECIKKALDFYLKDESLTDFNTLSHFNAYIIEALIDLGQNQRAQSAMDKIATYQRKDGFIPAYSHTKYTCSTGLFQYAICWAKLGGEENLKKADKAFYYALALQNASGGWFGSYGKKALYFPDGEISWAVKYFLDGLYYISQAKCDIFASFCLESIDENDGRYLIFKDLAKDTQKILDVGCGKGRYEKNLVEVYPNKQYFGVDFSSKVLDFVPDFIHKPKWGSNLLNIPYPNESFDLVFCSEALEHCIDTKKAIAELARVTKKGGKILIIDKPLAKLGALQLAEWEQWFEPNELREIMQKQGLEVQIHENIPYEDKADGLFVAWIGEKI